MKKWQKALLIVGVIALVAGAVFLSRKADSASASGAVEVIFIDTNADGIYDVQAILAEPPVRGVRDDGVVQLFATGAVFGLPLGQ